MQCTKCKNGRIQTRPNVANIPERMKSHEGSGKRGMPVECTINKQEKKEKMKSFSAKSSPRNDNPTSRSGNPARSHLASPFCIAAATRGSIISSYSQDLLPRPTDQYPGSRAILASRSSNRSGCSKTSDCRRCSSSRLARGFCRPPQ